MIFVDRIEEMRRLQRFLSDSEGGFACVYGRRRVGKSRLLAEAVRGRVDVVTFLADKSDAALQRSRLANDIAKTIPGFGSVVYPDWGSLFDTWQLRAAAGSVLIIDELPYIVERSPEVPSILQRIVDGIGPTGKKLILCGSSQRMMQGLVLNANEPLYGRAKVLLCLKPIGFDWLKTVFPGASAFELLERYGIWGGIPRYWEIDEAEGDHWKAVREQVFSEFGLLRNEPTYLLQDDLRDSVQSFSLLTLIGQGAGRITELASRLGVPASDLSRPMARLVDLELVRKERPFGEPESSKRTIYRLSDPFLVFWYRYVQPNWSDPAYLTRVGELERLKSDFRIVLGDVWEGLVRTHLQAKWRKVGRWWGTGLDRRPMELDVVAESSDGETLLVGECKLNLNPEECRREKTLLEEKIASFPLSRNYKRIETELFVFSNDNIRGLSPMGG